MAFGQRLMGVAGAKRLRALTGGNCFDVPSTRYRFAASLTASDRGRAFVHR
jgi:hypothetical protein